MNEAEKKAALQQISERHSEIVVIVSPPRCSSTTLARVFWEHPSFRFYCHEPFETMYFDDAGFQAAVDCIGDAIDLAPLKRAGESTGDGLVIKEMPYQVGGAFPELLSLATRPIIFLLREPLRAVYSRFVKKRQVGGAGIFPEPEMGFDLVEKQIHYCREQGIDHVVVESGDYRAEPHPTFAALFERLGLPFTDDLLAWRSLPDFDLDNLDGRHSHLYERVLRSTGIQPDDAPPPTLEDFPEDDGFRAGAAAQIPIYERLSADPQRLRAS